MSGSENQDYLDMHKQITEKVNEQTEKVTLEVVTTDEFLQEQIDSKKPITSSVNIPIPAEEFLQFTEEIASIIIKHQPQLQETIEAIMKVVRINDELGPFIDASKKLDLQFFQDFGEKNDINPAISQFLGEMAYRSYVIAFAKNVTLKMDINGYRSNLCPVCGEMVRVMRQVEDGKREACCTRCDTVWELASSQCPHCNNKDQKMLHYIKAGTDESRKIYACDLCNGYVKHVDMQMMIGKPSFFVVDLETIYLDMIAAQQGYGAVEKGKKGKKKR